MPNVLQKKLGLAGPPFDPSPFLGQNAPQPVYRSEYGALFSGDCLSVLPHIRSHSVHTVFADPPFNLGKEYGEGTDDLKPDGAYLDWCRRWLAECIRVLEPGGSIFVYNLPKWNIPLGAY